MSSSENEAELVARAVAGEDQALERLLLEHHDSLRWKLAGEVPASMRGFLCDEDILQQTYVEAFRSIRSFEPKGDRSFRAWLIAIAQHRLHDAIKAHRAAKRGGGQPGLNLPEAVGDSIDELIDLLAGPKGTPSQSVARHEAARAVHAALASLDADHRRVIQLRHLQQTLLRQNEKDPSSLQEFLL